MENFSIGQRVATFVQGKLLTGEITEIRVPNTLANWTSADQSKTVYKVQLVLGSRKYKVRQAHQLTAVFSTNTTLTLDAPFHTVGV